MKNRANKIFLILVIFVIMITNGRAEVSVKIKDISYIDGLKENQVYGYGLVVGLQGTGDTKKSPLTRSSLKNLLKTLGMEEDEIISKNSAAVLLTAQLPPFVRIGDRVDITVSSIGDAKSLEGGILVQSPLIGADNKIYVAAQGPLTVAIPKGNQSNRKAVKTVASISNGGVVEREINPDVVVQNSIFVVLRKWDYAVANNIIKAVQSRYPDSKPEMTNGGKIKIALVKDISLPEFIASIEGIEITPSTKARVVINEKEGTIVTGGEVKISEAMVSKEGVTVEIKNSEKKANASVLKDSASVKDLVDALNSIGVSTSDMISILKALKEAGALHAELIVR